MSDQSYHASQVMHHLGKIDDRKLREEAADEDAAMDAFRKVERVYMDIDEAMGEVARVVD